MRSGWLDRAQVLAVYAAFGDEADPFRLIEWHRGRGGQLAFPRVADGWHPSARSPPVSRTSSTIRSCTSCRICISPVKSSTATVKSGWIDHARQQLDEAIQGAKFECRTSYAISRRFRPRRRRATRTNVDVQSEYSIPRSTCAGTKSVIARRWSGTFRPTSRPWTRTNRRIGQVFLNLLINATQAMPERSGRARISSQYAPTPTRKPVGPWRRSSDNGSGIDPERSEPGVRAVLHHQGASPKGTGLGLAICRNIVHDCGGHHRRPNERAGQGYHDGRSPTAAPGVSTSLKPLEARPDRRELSGTRASVIVVDDEPLVGRSIRRALRGHNVRGLLGSGRGGHRTAALRTSRSTSSFAT